jgi:amidase
MCPLSAEVRALFEDLAGQLQRAGCAVARQSPLVPDLGKINRLFLTVIAATSTAGRPVQEQRRLIAARDALAPDDDSPTAAFLRGCGISYGDWMLLLGLRGELHGQLRAVLDSFDVLICPVAPTTAIPHQRGGMERTIDVDGGRVSYGVQGSWNSIVSFLGFPATVVPIGQSPETGLPIGAQVIGPYLEDHTPLAFAALLEDERGGFVSPPART